jgi:hypothetical protein
LPPSAPTGIEPEASSHQPLPDLSVKGVTTTDDRPPPIGALRAAVSSLYAKAETLEGKGRFERADQIRELARNLRAEIDRLGEEAHSLERSLDTGLQPIVTEATYNPQAVPEAAPPLPPPPVPSEPRPDDFLPFLPDLPKSSP